MSLTVARFKKLNKSLIEDNHRLIVAFSGGLDSCVLLHLVAACVPKSQLSVWHVNHNLQKAAAEMEQFCESVANRYALAYQSIDINLSHIRSNIEAEARQARYSAIALQLQKNDILLTAHHADDQAETLLLNLMRSSGVAGLRGVASHTDVFGCFCLRPLLAFSRHDILEYAQNNKLDWFEDPTNHALTFDRNYMRHEVVPRIKQRWPAFLSSFIDVSNHQQEAFECLEALAEIDLERCFESHQFSSIGVLSLTKLNLLTEARKKNLIKYWFLQYKMSLSRNQTVEIMKVLNNSQNEAKIVSLDGAFVGFFKQFLFLVLNDELKQMDDELIANLKGIINDNEVIVHRQNYKLFGLSTHFMKRLFQQYEIPPWFRDQTVFKLERLNLKKVIEFKVL